MLAGLSAPAQEEAPAPPPPPTNPPVLAWSGPGKLHLTGPHATHQLVLSAREGPDSLRDVTPLAHYRSDPEGIVQIAATNWSSSVASSNLVRAVAPYRLSEADIHDVLNIFQVTGLTEDDRYFVKPSPAKKGDFFEFFAEIDLLCAISTCPHGDLSVAAWGPETADPISTCRPLGVEVYQPAQELLEGWEPRPPSDYSGVHGIQLP